MTAERTETAPEPGTPAPVRPSRWPSLVWLVPAVAALVGLAMLFHAWRSAGPHLTVTFLSGSGVEAGKTPVKYKDVTVGMVSSIAISHDGSHVIVRIAMDKNSENLVHGDTRFWIVRPRLGIGGVSGIDTLVSGSYIGMDRGTSGKAPAVYRGLEAPPTVLLGAPGRSFVLSTQDLGSLDIGSPLYYHRIQVGRVASYHLKPDGRDVTLEVFVEAPYDRFVTAATRFWNAGGVDVSLNTDGFKLKTESLATLVAGGVAFDTAPWASPQPAPAQASYDLARDQQTAMTPPDDPPLPVMLHFAQPLRGLAVGANVQFASLRIGQVSSIQLDYDPKQHRLSSNVGLDVYPNRLGSVMARLPGTDADPQARLARFLADLVRHGLRAQSRSGNLITGQLYIDLTLIPKAPAVAVKDSQRPLPVPTFDNGSLDRMQEQASDIVAKIDRIPLDSIGRRLDSDLAGLERTLKQVNEQTLPGATRTLQQARDTLSTVQGTFGNDAPLGQNLNQTLQDVDRAARSLHDLLEQLSRHPQSLLRGVPDDPKPAASSSPESVP